MEPNYFVYIMTNKSNRVLYCGVTNNLYRRVKEHRLGIGSKFTAKYHVKKTVYYQIFESIYDALDNEKRLKGGSRQRKIDLIEEFNPDWKDLFIELNS